MRSASAQEFRRDPRGRYLIGHSFVLWAYDGSLAGSIYHGRPDPRDFPTLLAMSDLPVHRNFQPPLDAIVDCSALQGLDASAFEILLRYLTEVVPVAPSLRRVALVRPAGVVGATIAGLFYEAVQQRFAAALFTDRSEAVCWLQRADGELVAAAIDAMVTDARTLPPLLRALRQVLSERPRGCAIADAARALAVSARSLQRQLGELGTCFRAELERARLCVAEALLTGSDVKLAAIALDAGFGSPAHFSSAFRRITGESPSQFRERRRLARG